MLPDYTKTLPASFVIDLTNALYSDKGKFFSRDNLRDCLSSGQLLSKLWVLDEVRNLNLNFSTVHHLGCWHGLLSKYLPSEKIVLVEKDPFSLGLACEINKNAISVLSDAIDYCKNTDIGSSHCVLNTSCEHMADNWIHYLKPGTKIVAQSTDYTKGEGHINVKFSLESFLASLNLTDVLYSGLLEFPMYNRYLVIGSK